MNTTKQSWIGKLLKSVGIIALTLLSAVICIFLLGPRVEKAIHIIAIFVAGTIYMELSIIWKSSESNNEKEETKIKRLVIHCPDCGRSLKGATQEMIGDIGVCPKCKAEFKIEQQSGWSYRIGKKVGLIITHKGKESKEE